MSISPINIRATDLLPCPFCAGPPVTMLRDTKTDSAFNLSELPSSSSLSSFHAGKTFYVEVFVFCHECGAESESIDGTVYLKSCAAELVNQAREKWNDRNKRNCSLFDSSRSVNEENYLDRYFGEDA
ncbi:Lar family restriction alleviation protein [Pectobacterium brasiliense]|uniref:Lar family restriction alleviation protein n=1 Tax=Pectobacterium brasiliense TaxID=180957 RepID=UPI000B971CDD|nr:Lar family restriction alleviation protein [Pectobacterium carotovorum]OYN53231.1 hypothetical protein B7L51_01150 [Pectobacterium carotovorum]